MRDEEEGAGIYVLMRDEEEGAGIYVLMRDEEGRCWYIRVNER